MALINCKECNKEISDKALNCPNCGIPSKDLMKFNNTQKEESRMSFVFNLLSFTIISSLLYMACFFNVHDILPSLMQVFGGFLFLFFIIYVIISTYRKSWKD